MWRGFGLSDESDVRPLLPRFHRLRERLTATDSCIWAVHSSNSQKQRNVETILAARQRPDRSLQRLQLYGRPPTHRAEREGCTHTN